MHNQAEAQSASCGCPLQHLLIAIGISECCDRATPDVLVDPHRFSFFVIHEIDLRKAQQYWSSISHFKFCFDAAPNDLFRRNSVYLFRKRSQEFDPATGYDECLETICAKV